MANTASVRYVTGKQLVGTARHHTVVTDRPAADGGTDGGCTSGELLLIAIGSCSMSGVRGFFEDRGLPCQDLSVQVAFEKPKDGKQRDHIVISLGTTQKLSKAENEALVAAATSGAVVSRIMLGSTLEVRVTPPNS